MSEETRIQDTDWYQSRPPLVQQAIDLYPPNRLYRMKSTQQVVFFYSYAEGKDGQCETCTVSVTHSYNPEVVISRNVFGVRLDDLEVLSKEEEAWLIAKAKVKG